MADAAAFFANKNKKKKKAFKFNANTIDAATVTSTVHVYVSYYITVLTSFHLRFDYNHLVYWFHI